MLIASLILARLYDTGFVSQKKQNEASSAMLGASFYKCTDFAQSGCTLKRVLHHSGLTPVCETGIKTPSKFKQPVVGNEP
ncbi:hypothetical protein, partial [Paenibacillus polymyxa]|uniref:hypothetical protein n=1 Tax=Paenibacillus polymyxa TaxID=1406 RepID=UPI00163C81A6